MIVRGFIDNDDIAVELRTAGGDDAASRDRGEIDRLEDDSLAMTLASSSRSLERISPKLLRKGDVRRSSQAIPPRLCAGDDPILIRSRSCRISRTPFSKILIASSHSSTPLTNSHMSYTSSTERFNPSNNLYQSFSRTYSDDSDCVVSTSISFFNIRAGGVDGAASM